MLLLAHDRGFWPGREPSLATALLLAILIAPIALLEAVDQVETRLLLLWSGTLGFVIGTLGLWQQWRGGLEILPLAAIALLVFLAHVTLRAALREGKFWAGYRVWTAMAWTIGARLLVWSAIAAFSFLVLASLNDVFGWLLAGRDWGSRSPGTLLSMPLLGMASAAGFAVAANGRVQKRTRSTLLISFALALPILSAVALALPALYLTRAEILPAVLLAMAAALAIAVHALDWRQVTLRWHTASFAFFGCIILELTLVAGLDIHRRVAAHGWTDSRIYAAVAAFVLALYGLIYLAESFSAVRGRAPLKVLDRAIPAAALVVAAICLVLSTPLADPLALAVKSQMAHLKRSLEPVPSHLTLLKEQGVPFGQDATVRREPSPRPAPSRSLSIAPPPPVKARAVPSPRLIQPGAGAQLAAPRPAASLQTGPERAGDIIQHTAGNFPPELLTQNWSRTDAAPCITKASIGCDVWFLDLDGDGRVEILFAYGEGTRVKANVMQRSRRRWIEAAAVASPPCPGLLAQVRSRAAQTGDLLPGWRRALRISLGQRPGAPPVELPCPAR